MEDAMRAATKRNVARRPVDKKLPTGRKNPLTRREFADWVPTMKKVLSLLLVFVFLQVQTFALSGGPQYGGNQAAVAGTYAGVFTGLSGTATAISTGTVLVDGVGSNALGLFVIGVPQTDIAQGTVALFFEGTFYQGGILGIADPNDQTFSGVCQAIRIIELTTSTSLLFGDSSKTVSYDSRADGTIKADIGGGGLQGTTLEGEGLFTVTIIVSTPVTIPSTNPLLPDTTTIIQTSVPTGTLSFTVDGFKQSQEVIFPNQDSTASLLNGTGTSLTGGQ